MARMQWEPFHSISVVVGCEGEGISWSPDIIVKGFGLSLQTDIFGEGSLCWSLVRTDWFLVWVYGGIRIQYFTMLETLIL